jgi:acyl-CoA reductase-like NAD-dependent aldehyde dehydrogenase
MVLHLLTENPSDIEVVVTAVRAAFEDRRWPSLPIAQRKRIMIRFADLFCWNMRMSCP